MRRVAEALLLALLLVAVQTAILAHDHANGQAPAGAVQSCEFCAGSHGAMPAPDRAVATRQAAPPTLIAEPRAAPPRTARLSGAHRSRAPPSFRSI